MTRRLPCLLMAALLLSLAACSKSQPEAGAQDASDQPASVDHVVLSKAPPPNNFLHKTFAIKTSEEFAFQVPSHSVKPALHGSFVSFAKNKSGDLLSNETANVDLLILNDQEFDDFSHSKQGSATYTVDPSHSQTVTYTLHPTVSDAENYHLVFRNSPGGPRSKLVKADFTISFE
jgi:hypothetical protein